MRKGIVYFITYESDEIRRTLPVIKIGSTFDVNRRISELNTGSPAAFILAGYIQTPSPRKTEHSIHADLDEFRLNGEWFHVDEWTLVKLRKYDISDSKIKELFGLTDRENHHARIVSLESDVRRMASLIEEKDDQIKTMTKRLVEIDPLAHKFIPKISCKPKDMFGSRFHYGKAQKWYH